jgi:cobalamin 5'-phosphate synthase/cobalamin synthase
VIVIVIEALLTGALHLDGVADMADGFGGGRDRADVLRIMRDHAIGAYGATALILIILLKVTTISALCEHHLAEQYLIAGPALSRWATVLLSWLSPYARRAESDGVNAGGAVSDFIGRREFLLATLICAVVVGVVLRWRGLVSWAVVILSTAVLGRWSYKRIAGVTGDTLGANIEICETAVLLAGLVLSAT